MGVKKRVVIVGHVMLCLKGVLYPLMQLYPFKKNTDTQFSKSWLWLFLMVYVFSFPFLDCLPLSLNHRTILAPKNPLGNVNMSEMDLSAGLCWEPYKISIENKPGINALMLFQRTNGSYGDHSMNICGTHAVLLGNIRTVGSHCPGARHTHLSFPLQMIPWGHFSQ